MGLLREPRVGGGGATGDGDGVAELVIEGLGAAGLCEAVCDGTAAVVATLGEVGLRRRAKPSTATEATAAPTSA